MILADRSIDTGNGSNDSSVCSDSTGICLARVLIDHFKQVKFIVEVREESNIKFICRSPDEITNPKKNQSMYGLSFL